MGIKYRKHEKTPYLDNIQQQKAKKLSRRLCDHLRDAQCEIVMDDEKYFTFAGHKMPGNAGYYSNDKQTCPNSVRFAGKPLYPRKVLVWIAISERGFSKVLIRPSKSEAIDSETYINECLSKRLLPFLHKHHGDFNYIFWPDLASAHYSNETVAWMNENIYFVPKSINPTKSAPSSPNRKLLGLFGT